MITKKVPKPKRVFFLLLVVWLSPPSVIAAPLEDISLTNETDRVVATIKLSSPVSNVRYVPAKKGTTLSILLDKVPSGLAIEEWQDNETIVSPPSSLIPSFTVKTNLKNIQPKLIVEFSREAEYTVQMGRDARSIIIGIKIDRAATKIDDKKEKIIPRFDGTLPILPEVDVLTATSTDIDKKAAALMLAARNALAIGDNFIAIDTLNKLLLLPPNHYTQDAQEWVGVARERGGQLNKAKVELELYLKLYTDPEDVKRVKLRLASLGGPPPIPSRQIDSPTALSTTTGRKAFSQNLSYGSISMFYYAGASKTDTVDTAATLGSSASQSSISALEQSAFLASVFATERFITEKYDNRIVFQDTSFTNLRPDQPGKNRVGAAYIEVKNKISDYSVRLGRQSSSGSGVLGRFDGATVGYGIVPSVRINAVAGQLSDYGLLTSPTFYGASVDMGPVTVYAITQSVDDVVERKAVGAEIRYFDSSKSAFVSLDYDTIFSALNVAMVQATFTPTPERIFNLYIDHRRTPFLSIRNALYGSNTTSLTDLMQLMTEEEIRALAADRTGTSNTLQFGVTQQVSTKWQIGGDVRASRYEDMPASGTPVDPFADPLAPPPVAGFISASPSSGVDWAISQQLIGSALYSTRDVTVFNLSIMGSPLYRGQSLYIYTRGNITDKLSLDGSIQFYKQTFESGMLSTRVIPSIRTAYQIRQSVSMDLNASFEVGHTEQDTQITDTQRLFLSLGIRWDF